MWCVRKQCLSPSTVPFLLTLVVYITDLICLWHKHKGWRRNVYALETTVRDGKLLSENCLDIQNIISIIPPSEPLLYRCCIQLIIIQLNGFCCCHSEGWALKCLYVIDKSCISGRKGKHYRHVCVKTLFSICSSSRRFREEGSETHLSASCWEMHQWNNDDVTNNGVWNYNRENNINMNHLLVTQLSLIEALSVSLFCLTLLPVFSYLFFPPPNYFSLWLLPRWLSKTSKCIGVSCSDDDYCVYVEWT